jgi:hypothetical protein
MNSQPTLTSSDSVPVVVLPVDEEARRTPAAVRVGDKIVAPERRVEHRKRARIDRERANVRGIYSQPVPGRDLQRQCVQISSSGWIERVPSIGCFGCLCRGGGRPGTTQ